MAWTDETRAQAVKAYQDAKPTAETSVEIIKEIAEDMGLTANGVRMVLVQSGVYIKKEPSTSKAKEGTGGTRVSKESQIAALKEVLKDNGLVVDDEILDKLTGKAATYLTTVIKQAIAE